MHYDLSKRRSNRCSQEALLIYGSYPVTLRLGSYVNSLSASSNFSRKRIRTSSGTSG